MHRIHEPSDAECYTPPSEPFRFYLKFRVHYLLEVSLYLYFYLFQYFVLLFFISSLMLSIFCSLLLRLLRNSATQIVKVIHAENVSVETLK
jgi:hypothetical protein